MPKEKLEKIYLRVIEWGTYLALFSPLIFIRDYFFPFVVPKTIFFRLVVDFIFIAYILLALSNPKYRPRITSLTVAIAIFMGVLVLTSIVGINFSRSFWSVFERMTGLLTLFHLFAFYLVLTSVFGERKYWERILAFSILVSVLICAYTLTSKDLLTRGGGTLGNSSFLSSYLFFNIFFAIILLVWKRGFWRILYGLALTLFLFTLFFNPVTITRGVVSSLLIGLTLLAFGYLIFSGKAWLRRLAPAFLILMVFVGILAVKNFHFQDRPFNIKDIPDRSRQIVWNIAWKSWQERFWLGWGWENFNVPFIKYYDPELPITGDVWYDRVHNIILDLGVTSGLLGLLSYLSIFAVAVFELLKLLPKISIQKNIIIPLTMIALLLVYFLQNLWVFDMISSYIMFFLSLAFIGFLFSSERTMAKVKFLPLPFFVAVLLLFLTIFTFFFGNIQPARASKFILKGIVSPLEQSLVNFQKAFRTSPMVRFEGPEQLSMRISTLASQPGQDKTLLNQGFQLAEQEFKNSLTKNPRDFRLYLFLGRNSNHFYHFSGQKEKLVLAEEVLERALQLGPTNQQVYYIFAQTRFLQGKDEEALAFLQKAKDLEPGFTASRWHLLKGYRLAGRPQLALSELKELEGLGFDWKANPETLKEGIEILKESGENLELLIPLYEKGIELLPQDIYLWESLINAYIHTGQREKAKTMAKKLLEIKPEFAPQVEQLLKELGY